MKTTSWRYRSGPWGLIFSKYLSCRLVRLVWRMAQSNLLPARPRGPCHSRETFWICQPIVGSRRFHRKFVSRPHWQFLPCPSAALSMRALAFASKCSRLRELPVKPCREYISSYYPTHPVGVIVGSCFATTSQSLLGIISFLPQAVEALTGFNPESKLWRLISRRNNF